MKRLSAIKTLPGALWEKHNNLAFFVFLTALTLAIYHKSLFVYFLSDDFSIIGKFIEFDAPYLSFSDFFRPIPLVDLWIETQLFGLTPHLFRLVNFFLHALNAFLVYRFARLILENIIREDDQKRLAYLSAILFVVLPCHSETVIWIACRPDLLATLFSLACMISYLLWLRTENNRNLFISSLAFLFAFLSKESAFALPLLLIVITFFHESPITTLRKIKKYSLAISLFATGLILQFVLRYFSTHALLGGEESIINTTTPYFYNLFSYGYRTFLFPTSTLAAALTTTNNTHIISGITMLIIGFGLWKSDGHSRKAILFTLTGFIAALLPILHKTISLYELQMERYLYLPSVFVCIFIPVFLGSIIPGRLKNVAIFLYVVLMILFLNISIVRWNKASDIAMNSLREIKENFHSERLFAMGLPDSYKGVNVFRNGFPRAVIFFNKAPIKRKYIYMPAFLNINDDNLKMHLTHDTAAFHISLDSANSTLVPGQDLGAYNFIKDKENSLTVEYPEINNNNYQIMLYCNQQLMFYENCKD